MTLLINFQGKMFTRKKKEIFFFEFENEFGKFSEKKSFTIMPTYAGHMMEECDMKNIFM